MLSDVAQQQTFFFIVDYFFNKIYSPYKAAVAVYF